MQIDPRSASRMVGVHIDLRRVIYRAAEITPIDFIVTEGLRDLDRQKQLMAAGASKTLNSRHLTGHAVDLAARLDGEIRWDWPLYHKLADAVKEAARLEGVPIEWGGDWRKFKDGPHFQLPIKVYK
jgi:peptidoglycan L-alanyl-D-glutamate endopeptidase CwlK